MSLQNRFPQGSISLLRGNNLRGLPERVIAHRQVRTGHLAPVQIKRGKRRDGEFGGLLNFVTITADIIFSYLHLYT